MVLLEHASVIVPDSSLILYSPFIMRAQRHAVFRPDQAVYFLAVLSLLRLLLEVGLRSHRLRHVPLFEYFTSASKLEEFLQTRSTESETMDQITRLGRNSG